MAGHTDWDKHLDMVGFAYHNSSQASNGHSPFYLHYGEQPYTPIQMALDSHAAKKVPWTLDFLSKLQAGRRAWQVEYFGCAREAEEKCGPTTQRREVVCWREGVAVHRTHADVGRASWEVIQEMDWP